jgi:hypothetical protein
MLSPCYFATSGPIFTEFSMNFSRGRSSSPGRGKIFILPTSSNPILLPTQPRIQWVDYASAPTCIFMACCIINNFTSLPPRGKAKLHWRLTRCCSVWNWNLCITILSGLCLLQCFPCVGHACLRWNSSLQCEIFARNFKRASFLYSKFFPLNVCYRSVGLYWISDIYIIVFVYLFFPLI